MVNDSLTFNNLLYFVFQIIINFDQFNKKLIFIIFLNIQIFKYFKIITIRTFT
jgi:hypothetical protein